MKKLTLIGLMMLMAVIVIACGQNDASSGAVNDTNGSGEETNEGEETTSGKTYSLNVGIVVSEDDPIYTGLTEFKKNVEERTDGKVEVTIYPNSQLGDTPEIQEQAMSG